MRGSRRFGLVLLVGVALAAPSDLAARQAAVGRPDDPGPRPISGFAIFQALDVDHDGVLSTVEIANAPAVLKQLDRNGDGRVTADEMPAWGRGGRGGFADRGPGEREGFPGRGGRDEEPGEARPPSPDDLATTLMAFDKNGDGKLTKDELPERYQGILDRADLNKDGQLTVDELRRFAASQAQPADAAPEDGRGEDAGRGRRGGGNGPGPGFGPSAGDALLKALDANGDGVLSAEEIRRSAEVLRTFDRNGDGRVTLEELFPGAAGRGRD